MRFLLLFLLSITSGVTFAQDYPTRPVRMIEPFGAGGGPHSPNHTCHWPETGFGDVGRITNDKSASGHQSLRLLLTRAHPPTRAHRSQKMQYPIVKSASHRKSVDHCKRIYQNLYGPRRGI
jgi:hypothetical protein